MISRRTLTFFILALALIAPTAAHADKAKPKSSVPKVLITLTDGAVNIKAVNPTITTTFAPPAGTSESAACKGKVTVSVQVGTKTVKKKKVPVFVSKKSPLKAAQGICTANTILGLPRPFLGTTKKFSVKFPGNDVVKKFSKSSSFKLVATPLPAPVIPTPTPPAPPTIHAGRYGVHLADPGVTLPAWQFEIKADGSVDGISQSGSVPVTCESGFQNTSWNTPKYLTPFTYIGDTAAIEFHNTGSGAGINNHYDIATNFNFNINSSGLGTGTVDVSGTFVTLTAGGSDFDEAHCSSGTINLVLEPVS